MKTLLLGLFFLSAVGCAKYWTREFQLVEIGKLNESVDVKCELIAFRGIRHADTSLHRFSFSLELSGTKRNFEDTLFGKQWQENTDQLFNLDSCIIKSVNSSWIRNVTPRRKIMGKTYHYYSILYEMWFIDIPPNVTEIALAAFFSGHSSPNSSLKHSRSDLRLIRNESTYNFLPLD